MAKKTKIESRKKPKVDLDTLLELQRITLARARQYRIMSHLVKIAISVAGGALFFASSTDYFVERYSKSNVGESWAFGALFLGGITGYLFGRKSDSK